MTTHPIYLRPELTPLIAETPEQTTWDLPAMRAAGDVLLANPYEANNRVEVTARSRTFIPADCAKNAPLIISIHGGGYVAGRAAFDDAKNDELASRFGAIVVSPEYRLAPEFPFPIPVDDCITALDEAIERFGRERPTFIFGDSAGAGLVYSMVTRLFGVGVRSHNEAVLARYRHLASVVKGIVMLEPCIDPSLSTASSAVYADGPVWTRRAASGAWRHYFGMSVDAQESVPRAIAAAAFPRPTALFREKGFPPALIVVNPVDPLRDAGIVLATALIDAGLVAALHMFAGTFHGSLSVPESVVWEEIQALLARFIGENSRVR